MSLEIKDKKFCESQVKWLQGAFINYLTTVLFCKTNTLKNIEALAEKANLSLRKL